MFEIGRLKDKLQGFRGDVFVKSVGMFLRLRLSRDLIAYPIGDLLKAGV